MSASVSDRPMSPRTGSSSVGESSSSSEAAMTSPSSSVAADNGCNGGGGGRRFTVRERGPVELQEVQTDMVVWYYSFDFTRSVFLSMTD